MNSQHSTLKSPSQASSNLRVISEGYLESKWQDIQTSQVSHSQTVKKVKLDHSGYLPLWIYSIIAKCLGIKLSPTDKPYLATAIYVSLFILSMTFGVTGAWIMVYDVISPNTPTSAFNEVFNFILGFGTCAMGIYAFKLLFNVFSSRFLLKNIRLHTRTVLKINIAVLLTTLLATFLGIYIYQHMFVKENKCSKIGLPVAFCLVHEFINVIYVTLSAALNLCIIIVIMSVTRTQTIVVRRFKKELEFDAKVQIAIFEKVHSLPDQWADNTDNMLIKNTIVDSDDDNIEEGYDDGRQMLENFFSYSVQELIDHDRRNIDDNGSEDLCELETSTDHSNNSDMLLDFDQANLEKYKALLLTSEDLYFRHCRIQRTMRHISLIFQRWTICLILLVLIWCISYIISWLAITPVAIDFPLFVIPIFLMFLVCSGYAEVNNECQDILRNLYGRDDRTMAFRFYLNQPLYIGVFNIAMTYALMLSVMLAMGIALLSKIILDELPRTHH